MSKNQSDLELRRTILIVDDDPGSRKTLRDILEIKGYTTEVFATGKPAVEWAKQDKVAIAL
ncbi:MAG: response regulator, partial [Anaerolineales bacterium]